MIRSTRPSLFAAPALVALLLAGAQHPLGADDALLALGEDLTVSVTTASDQILPAVATDTEGRFLVVWNDIGGAGILARPFAADGTPLAGEVAVSELPGSVAERPDVAWGGDAFLVVWGDVVSAGDDADGTSIQARRFAADGAPLGAQVQVGAHTPGSDSWPRVAADPASGFVVAWSAEASPGDDAAGRSVQARWLDGAGQPVGAQVQVNVATTGDQDFPDVAVAADGAALVTWTTRDGADGSGASVHARRIVAPGGRRSGAEVLVNAWTTGSQERSVVTALASGDAVVVWQGHGADSPAVPGLYARRLDAAGAPSGDELTVRASTTIRRQPSVAPVGDGGFVVAWEEDLGYPSNYEIVALRLDAAGTAVGSELAVNTFTTSYQFGPDLAAGPDGRFVVVWDGATTTGDPTYGVRGRRLLRPDLFADGFESGDLAAWAGSPAPPRVHPVHHAP